MTDISITFTECFFGAETLHKCETLAEAVNWAISLLEGDKAVPVRIVYDKHVLWDCTEDNEEDLNYLVQNLNLYKSMLDV